MANQLGPPPGLIVPGTRTPQGDLFAGAPLGAPQGPPGGPQTAPGAPARQGQAPDPMRDQATAWRPVTVYVGDVSADTEVCLLVAPFRGIRILRVGFKVRGTVSADASHYWTFRIVRRLVNETEVEVEKVDTSGAARDNESRDIYHRGIECRMEEGEELSVQITKTGSPAALSQVALYADVYAGI